MLFLILQTVLISNLSLRDVLLQQNKKKKKKKTTNVDIDLLTNHKAAWRRKEVLLRSSDVSK